MKAKELMIGDWIYSHTFNGLQPRKIRRINPENIEEYEPIPLTPDILEKNFKEYLPGINLMYKLKGPYMAMNEEGNQWVFGLVKEAGADSKRFPLVKITYVHELQHALRLCGIDKEITL